jgi:hypothetical protein
MRILLYNPDNGVTRNFMPHLWMFLLQALTPHRHEVLLIDGNAQPMNETQIAQFVRDQNIGLVGIGAMTRMVARAYRMADAKAEEAKDTDSKEKLVSALKASFDFCSDALAKMDDSKLAETTEGFGGKQNTHAWFSLILSGAWADHYGAAATDLRLNGALPPTAKK